MPIIKGSKIEELTMANLVDQKETLRILSERDYIKCLESNSLGFDDWTITSNWGWGSMKIDRCTTVNIKCPLKVRSLPCVLKKKFVKLRFKGKIQNHNDKT